MVQKNNKKESDSSFSSYDLFVAVLSVLSIFNIVLYFVFDSKSILYVIGIIDFILSLIFFIDFLHRFLTAKSKSRYFILGYGWADLLASIPLPQFKILRLFRIVKAYSMISEIGPRNVVKDFFKNKASSALYSVLFFVILLLEFGSIAVLYAESSDPNANIKSASDAIWWVYVTITTVGYGDKYPLTNSGRFIGMLVMFVGVGLFGVLTGFLANRFLSPDNTDEAPSLELQKIQNDLDEIKALLKNNTY